MNVNVEIYNALSMKHIIDDPFLTPIDRFSVDINTSQGRYVLATEAAKAYRNGHTVVTYPVVG